MILIKTLVWISLGVAAVAGAVFLLFPADHVEKIDRFPVLEGPYLGQTPPGQVPQRFAPDLLGTDLHAPPIFSPAGDEMYWRRMADEGSDDILWMRQQGGVWGQPEVVPFASRFFGSDSPFLSSDGKTLCFTSFRPRSLAGLFSNRESIWLVERTARGWSSARAFEALPSGSDLHWAFSVTDDGTLYYAEDGDIYTARIAGAEYQEPVPIGSPINTAGRDEMPFVASDGSYMLFTSDGHLKHLGNSDLYVSARRADGSWNAPIHLPAPINSRHQDIYPVVSPDGATLFFLSTRHGEHGAYWVDASVFLDLLEHAP